MGSEGRKLTADFWIKQWGGVSVWRNQQLTTLRKQEGIRLYSTCESEINIKYPSGSRVGSGSIMEIRHAD